MTMKTDELISSLAADTRTPIRRLRPPFVRLMAWLALSVPWVVIVVAVMHLRPDLAAKLQESRWMVEQGASLATALTAAMAAFCAGVPGRPRWELFMPLAPLLLWLGALGTGCVSDWIAAGPHGMSFEQDWECLPGIVMVGMVPGIAMAAMLHRGAPLAPTLSVGLGGLAAAALADFGLRLFHTQDAGLMVLIWQVGTVALLTMLSTAIGRRLLRWRHLAPR